MAGEFKRWLIKSDAPLSNATYTIAIIIVCCCKFLGRFREKRRLDGGARRGKGVGEAQPSTRT